MERIVLKTFLIIILFKESLAKMRFEGITCNFVDKDYFKVDLCAIKPNQEKIPALYLTIQLLSEPITNCIVNTQVDHMHQMARLLVVNHTWNACEFLKNQKRQALIRKIMTRMAKYSNVNHSCPYKHDIYVKDYAPADLFMPVPTGKYRLSTSIIVNGKQRFGVQVNLNVF